MNRRHMIFGCGIVVGTSLGTYLIYRYNRKKIKRYIDRQISKKLKEVL